MTTVEGTPAALEAHGCELQTSMDAAHGLCDGRGPDPELPTIGGMATVTTVVRKDSGMLPELPLELVTVIFKIAARQSKEMAMSLSLVSHAARAVVLPLLFRTLIYRRSTKVHALKRFLRAHPSIANSVRELWIGEGTSEDAGFVMSCVSLERLAVTPSCYTTFCHLGDLRSTLSLERDENGSGEGGNGLKLICSPNELLLLPHGFKWFNAKWGGIGYMRLFFPSLTRLCMTEKCYLQELLREHDICDTLSSLTHLASPTTVGPELRTTVRDVLNTFRSLQMFVITPVIFGFERRTGNISPEETRQSNRLNYVRHVNDSRVHLLDADNCKTEYYLFEAWKGEEFGIWNCSAMHCSCCRLAGVMPTESSVEL